MTKKKCAIIGPGNVGMNLLCKIEKSDFLECVVFVGRDSSSKNLKIAQSRGHKTSCESLDGLINESEEYEIVFDATTSDSHSELSSEMRKRGKFIVDLTPSKIGRLCVPILNGKDCIYENEVNMVTCGGQSMVPLAAAISQVCNNITYIETVSTISSNSAGKGTRDNIDDYILTTQEALKTFTGVENTKSMIVLNPAKPPIIMHNTLYVEAENPDIDVISKAVFEMEQKVREYVPGFRVIVKPTLLRDNIIVVSAQVEGSGDYLPKYAGNLDIITCAAIEIAEQYAKWEIEDIEC